MLQLLKSMVEMKREEASNKKSIKTTSFEGNGSTKNAHDMVILNKQCAAEENDSEKNVHSQNDAFQNLEKKNPKHLREQSNEYQIDCNNNLGNDNFERYFDNTKSPVGNKLQKSQIIEDINIQTVSECVAQKYYKKQNLASYNNNKKSDPESDLSDEHNATTEDSSPEIQSTTQVKPNTQAYALYTETNEKNKKKKIQKHKQPNLHVSYDNDSDCDFQSELSDKHKEITKDSSDEICNITKVEPNIQTHAVISVTNEEKKKKKKKSHKHKQTILFDSYSNYNKIDFDSDLSDEHKAKTQDSSVKIQNATEVELNKQSYDVNTDENEKKKKKKKKKHKHKQPTLHDSYDYDNNSDFEKEISDKHIETTKASSDEVQNATHVIPNTQTVNSETNEKKKKKKKDKKKIHRHKQQKPYEKYDNKNKSVIENDFADEHIETTKYSNADIQNITQAEPNTQTHAVNTETNEKKKKKHKHKQPTLHDSYDFDNNSDFEKEISDKHIETTKASSDEVQNATHVIPNTQTVNSETNEKKKKKKKEKKKIHTHKQQKPYEKYDNKNKSVIETDFADEHIETTKYSNADIQNITQAEPNTQTHAVNTETNEKKKKKQNHKHKQPKLYDSKDNNNNCDFESKLLDKHLETTKSASGEIQNTTQDEPKTGTYAVNTETNEKRKKKKKRNHKYRQQKLYDRYSNNDNNDFESELSDDYIETSKASREEINKTAHVDQHHATLYMKGNNIQEEKSNKKYIRQQKQDIHNTGYCNFEGDLSDNYTEKAMSSADERTQTGKETEVNIKHNYKQTGKLEFKLSRTQWCKIEPETRQYGGRGRTVRRLKGQWTDTFSTEINKFESGCVLVFKTHNVKKKGSRKLSSPFVTATAECSGQLCTAKYQFSIADEPSDQTKDIVVSCTTSGRIIHNKTEVNRRNLKGIKRANIEEELSKAGSFKTFQDNLVRSNTEQLDKGNFTNVPNPSVLRKIVSEQLKKENMHENIFAELQLLKEAYDNENDPFIREIGLEPFYVILYSDKQIDILRQHGKSTSLHIDATGNVIIPIHGQKRPYLYSIVLRPNPTSPPISIADMITTQHNVPKIEYFMKTVQREARLGGKVFEVNQIETDFSYPLIQAVLQTFNSMPLKKYLHACDTILTKNTKPLDFTVLHLCAAHMFKDFTRQLKKYEPSMSKSQRFFVYRVFGLLQNVTSLEDAKLLFKDICYTFASQSMTSEVEVSVRNIEKRLANAQELNIDIDDICIEKQDEELDDLFFYSNSCTIRESSPFNEIFVEIAKNIDSTSNQNEYPLPNRYFSKNTVKCLIERFMYLLPLWSGLMLEEMSRNTNADVESWFKVVKRDCLKAKHNRPAKFVIQLRKLVYGRMMELEYPGARAPKTKSKRKRKAETEHDISLIEEIWDRTPKKRRFQPTNQRKTKETKTQLPSVPSWGGTSEGQHLSNTCTIDNGLTILHLKASKSQTFADKLKTNRSDLFITLQTVLSLMSEQCYSSAKLVWVNFTNKSTPCERNRDIYGDETDFFFSFFEPEWRSHVVSTCNEPTCPQSYKISGEVQGITVSLEQPVSTVQDLLDKWLMDKTQCCARRSPAKSSNGDMCHGTRTTLRSVDQFSPVMVIRVREHCANTTLNLTAILASTDLHIQDKTYAFAGVTLYRDNHFCAIVSTEYGHLWYDGLVGELRKIGEDVQKWLPSNAVFCEI